MLNSLLPPIPQASDLPSDPVTVEVWEGGAAREAAFEYQRFYQRFESSGSPSFDPRWLTVVCHGLRHRPLLLLARQGGETVGVLPLALVKSALFGRFLVSLPYVNSSGLLAENDDAARALVDRAVLLADKFRVRHLELRHESELAHPALRDCMTSKVHMRLGLPATLEELDGLLKSKVRNKVKKGEKQGFTTHWGNVELLDEFYEVFCINMRDLGTPVFSRKLFRTILSEFVGDAEVCVVRDGKSPIAAALLVHGRGMTEVPSGSSLRAYNSTNVNDWMYWQLLQRAVQRGQRVFDFGRSTVDSNTYVFKKKWGAEPAPAVWQYYVREGSVSDMRVENSRFALAIKVWQKLPVWLTKLIGPAIVRGIP